MLDQLSFEATYIFHIISRHGKICGTQQIDLIFFRLLPSSCLNWKIYCDDHFSVSSTTAGHMNFIYISHYFLFTTTFQFVLVACRVNSSQAFHSINKQKPGPTRIQLRKLCLCNDICNRYVESSLRSCTM